MEENSSLSSPQAQPPQINPTAVQPSTPPQKKSVIPFLLIIFGVLEILFCFIFFPKFASLTLNIFGNIPTATVSIIIVVIIALVQIALGIFQAVNHRMLSPKQRNISLILLITSPILTMALTAFFISMTLSSVYKEVACTADAKICPDGSSVGRTGPSCEFAPCPMSAVSPSTAVNPSQILNQGTTLPSPTPDPTANWKTFKSQFGKISLKYPSEFILQLDEMENRFITAENRNMQIQNIFLKSTNNISLMFVIQENSNYTSNDDFQESMKFKFNYLPASKHIVIGSLPAFMYTDLVDLMDSKKYYQTEVGIYKSGLMYTFTLNSPQEIGNKEELLKQILSTFKFTN